MVHHKRPRLAKNLVPHKEGGSDGKSAVSGRGMNVNLLEGRRIKNFSIGYAVECHASRQANGFHSRSVREFLQHAEVDFFEPRLKRSRQVAMALLQRLVRRARRAEAPFHSF